VARPPQGLFITQTPERRLRAGTALFGTPISDNVGTIDFPTGQFEAITNNLPAGNYTLTAFASAEQYSARKHVERGCRRSLHQYENVARRRRSLRGRPAARDAAL
jgi:hypothetical protein